MALSTARDGSMRCQTTNVIECENQDDGDEPRRETIGRLDDRRPPRRAFLHLAENVGDARGLAGPIDAYVERCGDVERSRIDQFA